MATHRSLAAARQAFVADNAQWREALGYKATDFTVQAMKRRTNLVIVAMVDDDFSHEVSIPAKGMHLAMREAIAESFREAIGTSKYDDLIRRTA